MSSFFISILGLAMRQTKSTEISLSVSQYFMLEVMASRVIDKVPKSLRNKEIRPESKLSKKCYMIKVCLIYLRLSK